MEEKHYQEITEQFEKILADISAFDNLIEHYCGDRQKYLDFNNMLFEVLGDLGNLADFLDLDIEI